MAGQSEWQPQFLEWSSSHASQGTESADQLFTPEGRRLFGTSLHVDIDPTRIAGRLRGWEPVKGHENRYSYHWGMGWRWHTECERDPQPGMMCTRWQMQEARGGHQPDLRGHLLKPMHYRPNKSDCLPRTVTIPGNPKQVTRSMSLKEYQQLLRP